MPTNDSNFWNKKEGLTAKGILGILGIGALIGIYKILPFIITLAENMFIAVGLFGGLIALCFIATSDRVATLLFYTLQSISRFLTSVVVETDPVGILMAFIKDMEKKKETVQKALTAMMGVRQANVAKARKAQQEMEDFLKKANAAQQAGPAYETDLQTMTELAGRRQQMIESFNQNIQFSTNAIEALTRVKKVIEYHITNSRDEADKLKSDFETATQMLTATHAATAALGDSDKLDVRNMAVEVIRNKVAQATGQVESLMESTRNVQGEMDLTKLTFQADGAAKLAELQRQLNQADAANLPRATATMIGSGAAQPIVQNRWADRLKVNKGNDKL